jgi:hypothetical protein
MSDLHRLTTQVVDTEDRIRLCGEDAHGAVQVLWLTQRLLGRLVPVLCRQLAPDADGHAELLSSFKQEAAQAQLVPQPSVQAAPASAQWLVTRIDVEPMAQGLRLAFFTKEEVAAVVMSELPMRQWLAVLRNQFREAGWPEDMWPAWTDPGTSSQGGAEPKFH